jgi:gluconolactonase
MRRVQLHEFQDLARRAPRRPDPAGFDRRGFVAAAAGVAAATGMVGEAFARNFDTAEPQRYPDPDIVALDKRFAKLGNTPIQRLYTGTLWAEGCAWNGSSRYVVWSDIPRAENLRYLEEDDHVGRRFRAFSRHSNGNTFDFQGRQISFCHEPASVIRYEHDGSVTELATQFEGQRFNAPNDGMVHPNDGSIWFTDPGYGALMNYEGRRYDATTPQPFRKEAVYRIDARSGAITKVTDEPFKPNGMCFSHDYTKVYVADTGTSHYADRGAKAVIWEFPVEGERLGKGRHFCSAELDGKTGNYDGIRVDEAGNLWAAAGWIGDGYDGVHCFAPDGTRIGQIRLPEICGNLCFGGTKRNRLFMAASQSLYAVYVETRGAHIT